MFRFDNPTWVQEQQLLASNGQENDLFGTAVAVRNGTIVVSAGNNDDNGLLAGSAYVYRFNPDESQWIEEQTLVASTGSDGGHYGSSVAIHGDTVLIGARIDDGHCDNCGAAYVLTRDATPSILGDLDGDDSVGLSDMLILLANWGPCVDCDNCPADLDGDCSVGLADLLILLENWG